MSKIVSPSTKNEVLLGTLGNGQRITNEPYEPVDCDFTDDQEFISIKRILVAVKHGIFSGELQDSSGYIVNIFTKNKEEFIVMSDSNQIRLDRIFQIRILNE